MWQDKKSEESFKQLALLIQNYDKEDVTNNSKKKQGKLGGKLSKNKRPLVKVTKEPVLQTVDERDEEDHQES